MKNKIITLICLICISLSLNSCNIKFEPEKESQTAASSESLTTENENKESHTESQTTSGNSTGENTTDTGSAEENTTEQNTTDSSPRAKKTHFTDSLSNNGPMTDGCLPSTGSPSVLVVPINLDNSKANDSLLDKIEIAFNGTRAQTGWYSVSEYYYISSYGKLDIDFDVLDEWFTPDGTADDYEYYYDEDGYYGSTLILDEVLTYYEDRIDFSKYDSDNDGIIDAIWLIYNCDVNYYSDESDFWAYVYQHPWAVTVDGLEVCYYGFAGTDFMFEEEPDYPNEDIIIDAHTYIHETGHLMGLDDYYDYNPDIGALGGFYYADMMDSNIGDHSSINKLLLGWIDPIIISGKGSINIDLKSFVQTGEVLLISNHNITSIYDEYILIEFYTPTLLNENDMPISPGADGDDAYGIRILHIDARIFYNQYGEVDFNNDNGYATGFLYDNSDEEKLFVDTLYCEKTDEWATAEMLFTPNSSKFGNVYSGYKYHNGAAINFDITVNSMTNSQASLTITIK